MNSSHLDSPTPAADGHPTGIVVDRCIGVPSHPLLQGVTSNLEGWVFFQEAREFLSEHVRIATLESMTKCVEKAATIAGLTYDSGRPEDDIATGCAHLVRMTFRTIVHPSVFVLFAVFVEVRTPVGGVLAIALVASSIAASTPTS
eukprot:CAMPEP_0206489304 /NCGR_PEP_ID=MMETSP0324_2-20121206/43133_1 /ASSEMBLY_ACC=CAM_ASM_000836 /TAXON_ID=2866 /ORGANISM="Crypthecodinium cohnii, Strain Seligo" /LENGTH=144 /DNA_ID=CAMNT_0053968903 /DNA_START=354 /DNA_END=789 /DNA_ORIENTATION=+